MSTQKTDSAPPASPAPIGSACVFSECQAICPHRHEWQNEAGGTVSDCTHPENGNGKHLPCLPEVCPVFESIDPEGDRENCRSNEEVEGRHYLPNDQAQRPPTDGERGAERKP